MVSRLKAGLTFPNVVAVLALFVALGGSAYAAGVLPANSVGTPQLKGGSVTSGKVKDGTLKAVDFARNQLRAGPRGARGPEDPKARSGLIDGSQVYVRATSDPRYLRGGLVTVVGSTTLPGDTAGGVPVSCPAGYQAIREERIPPTSVTCFSPTSGPRWSFRRSPVSATASMARPRGGGRSPTTRTRA